MLSDDGVGIYLAKSIQKKLTDIDVQTTLLAGLNLLDLIVGYDVLFVVDASFASDENNIGKLRTYGQGNTPVHLFSSHGFDFFEIVELGNSLKLNMPKLGAIYGIEISKQLCFSTTFSDVISEQILELENQIISDIQDRISSFQTT
ncbi:MAG: hydrogenase maturation protease [Desulfobacterales bacterium]|nr:hydrogenase maturation protease [Desulfobacterales bacterium]